MQVFVVPGSPPGAPLRHGPRFAIVAKTIDEARTVARERLEADGYRVRVISIGPSGLLAYVEERAT